ncbi:energy transducer TonB [Massilia sp. 9I]|uniref:energy transducer TonB n=1 Tax=Massilia sp. 9I TaxID=2653152 RepID=UPI0012EFF974|nr:energy transducer TonB [Massilia sp. 9I]VXB88105.1 TonB family domain-containing protein [Massilia sp. 9I]
MSALNHLARPAQYARAGLFAVALALAAPGIKAMQAAPESRPLMDTTTCSRPVYPEEDARLKNTGTVTMQFLLGPDGRVIESKIQKSSGFRSLDEAARSALVKCRFRPPMVDGKPVQAWTAVQYVWTPE